MKTLGIIGGMGPAATVDLMSKIINFTPGKKDQDHIHMVVDNYPSIPDRTAAILYGGEDPFPFLLESARRLESCKVDILMIPCNTAHYYLDALSKKLHTPFLSIIKCAVYDLKDKYPGAKKVAVIATTGTNKAKVYEKELAANSYTVADFSEEDDIQKNIMDCIYKGVKRGKTYEYLPLFQETIDLIISKYSPDVQIAGCTEVTIYLPLLKKRYNIIDATTSLAKHAVDFAKNG